MSHFKDIINRYNTSNLSINDLLLAISCLYPVFDYVEIHDVKSFWEAMKNFHEHIKGHHFDEMYAKYQVSQMYHTKKDGNVCRGEKFSIDEAKHIYEKYIRNIDSSNNCWDVYVAINAQYHDYAKMYNEWYNNITIEDLNNKIINSAITFWFKDEDAGHGKVWNYFRNIA